MSMKNRNSERFPDDIKSWLESQDWIFAKTYAKKWPHDYLVRERVDEDMFLKAVVHTRVNGYIGKFYKSKIPYFDEDGYVYWTMGAPLDITIILNRCRLEQTYEYRLEHGLLPTGTA